VAGAALSAAAQLAAGVGYYGIGPLRSWLNTIWQVPATLSSFEPRPYQTHCLRTFWSMLVPWSEISLGLYAVSGAVVLGLMLAIWRSQESLSVKFSALLLATVLISPHLTVYDLVILGPAILLLANWVASNCSILEGIGSVLYAVYVLPLLGPFTRWIHVQLSVIAMTVLLYWIWRVAAKSASGAGLRPAGQPAPVRL
jgi:hypothetical protein